MINSIGKYYKHSATRLIFEGMAKQFCLFLETLGMIGMHAVTAARGLGFVDKKELMYQQLSAKYNSTSGIRAKVKALNPLWFLLPALLFMTLWIYWPLIKTIYYSGVEWNLLPTSMPKYTCCSAKIS